MRNLNEDTDKATLTQENQAQDGVRTDLGQMRPMPSASWAPPQLPRVAAAGTYPKTIRATHNSMPVPKRQGGRCCWPDCDIRSPVANPANRPVEGVFSCRAALPRPDRKS